MKLKVSFALLISMLIMHLSGWAQAVDPGFAPVNIYMTAALSAVDQQADGKYVVSGNFTRINGAAVSSIVRLNANGTLDQSFSDHVTTRSSVTSMYVLPNGQIIASTGGAFVINGQSYSNLIKLNADGTVAHSFGTGVAGVIFSLLVQPDGKVVVAGRFTSFNGTPVPGMVRLNTDGSIDQAFVTALGTGFTGDVYVTCLEANGRILVGGAFSNFNATGRRALIRLEPTGELDTSYEPSTSAAFSFVSGLAIDPVTGQAVVATTAGELSRLNTDGTNDPSFSHTTSNYCASGLVFNNRKLLVDSSRRILYARGCIAGFTIGPENNYLTRYLPSGAVDTQFSGAASTTNGIVNVLFRQRNGQIIAGGEFSQLLAAVNACLVRFNDQAQVDSDLRPVLDATGSVAKIVRQADGKLVLGGAFREINGLSTTNIARLNADGTPDVGFAFPIVNRPIQTLAVQPDGKILLGGDFTTVDGVASNSIARLLPNGRYDQAFASYVTTARVPVMALAMQPDGAILMGGNSQLTINGRSAPLHRLQANGQPDVAYAQNTGTGPVSSVNDLALLSDGRHYVGGLFLRFNGVPTEGIVRLLPTGALDPSFLLPATSTASRNITKFLPLANDQVLVGGFFTNFGNSARAHLVRLNADGTVDPSLNANLTSGLLSELYQQPDGKIIVSAPINQVIGGVNQGVLLRLNANGSFDNSFTAGLGQIDSSVRSFIVQPNGNLVLGGGFSQVYGQARMAVARIIAPSVLSVSRRQSSARTEAWPNPAHSELRLRLDAAAQPRQLTLSDAVGKTIWQQAVTTTEFSLPVQQLKAGVYLLRVEYAAGPVTRRIVVE